MAIVLLIISNRSPGSIVVDGEFTVQTDDTNQQAQGTHLQHILHSNNKSLHMEYRLSIQGIFASITSFMGFNHLRLFLRQ